MASCVSVLREAPGLRQLHHQNRFLKEQQNLLLEKVHNVEDRGYGSGRSAEDLCCVTVVTTFSLLPLHSSYISCILAFATVCEVADTLSTQWADACRKQAVRMHVHRYTASACFDSKLVACS